MGQPATKVNREQREQLFCRIIRRVPKGRVATYGQIAALAGLPAYARHVGHALRSLAPDSRVPWYRIVNARGEIAVRSSKHSASAIRRDCETEQAFLLCGEGVEFDENGRIDMSRFQWRPRKRP